MVAVLLAVVAFANDFDIAGAAGIVGALCAAVDLVRRRIQGEDRTISDPAVAGRLVDEVTFMIAATHDWPVNPYDVEWVMKQIRRFLTDPVLIDKRKARDALNETERLFEETKAWEPIQASERRGVILEALFKAFPPPETFRETIGEAVEHIPRERRAEALKAGFYRMDTPQGDEFWAWHYIELLQHFGHRETLLELVKERLVAIRRERIDALVRNPLPQLIYQKAYDAFRTVAYEALGVGYRSWYEREVWEPTRATAEKVLDADDYRTWLRLEAELNEPEAARALERLGS